MTQNAPDMGSEGQDRPGEHPPGRRGVLRWILALGAAGVALTFGIAALVPGHEGTAPTVRPRAMVRAPDHTRDQRIVFASRSDSDGRYHIHVVNPDGTGETALTSGPDEDKTPAWSPNRDLIAFTRVPQASGSSEKSTHLYIMNADGSGLVQLTDGPDDAKDPSWSPDGRRIAFTDKDGSGKAHLVIADVDGTPPPQLPLPPAGCVDQEPAWAPDGLTLAFARRCGDEPSSLYLMHLDGTGLRVLTSFGRTPDWSPDGSRIAYTGLGSYGPAVYLINADGTGKVELTTDFSGDPVWSPDGSKIVFTVSEVAIVKLYVINVDGTGIRRLTKTASNEVAASW
jgi:TolB protein